MKPATISFVKDTLVRLIAVASFGILAALATGCTNNFANGSYQAANTANWGKTTSSSTTNIFGQSTSGFLCPDTPNVLPDYDYNDNGTDDYTVCSSTANTAEFVVHGITESSPEICVFAANYVDDQHVYALPDVTDDNLPWVQCTDTSLNLGVGFIFSGVSFNYLYIVEGPDKLTMQDCLITGNTLDCPHYSAGKFR